jgi:hypothetical protein
MTKKKPRNFKIVHFDFPMIGLEEKYTAINHVNICLLHDNL